MFKKKHVFENASIVKSKFGCDCDKCKDINGSYAHYWYKTEEGSILEVVLFDGMFKKYSLLRRFIRYLGCKGD